MGLFLFFLTSPQKFTFPKHLKITRSQKKKYMEGYLELVELYLFYVCVCVCVLLVDFLLNFFDFRIFKRQRKEKM